MGSRSVLLTGFVGATGLVLEKSIYTDFVIKSGDVWLTRIIEIENYDKFPYADLKSTFSYEKYMNTYPVLEQLILNTDSDFKYDKFCKGWDKKSKVEKYQWLQTHLFINTFGSGVYEIVFVLRESDAKDLDYVIGNGENFLNYYMQYSNTVVKTFNDNANLKLLQVYNLYPETKPVNRNKILIKYGIVGFVLGIILSITVISINSVLRFKNGK